jgi:hypothetical protein
MSQECLKASIADIVEQERPQKELHKGRVYNKSFRGSIHD